MSSNAISFLSTMTACMQLRQQTCTPMLFGRGAAPKLKRLASTPTFRPLRTISLHNGPSR